jgi:feruloyl esterase
MSFLSRSFLFAFSTALFFALGAADLSTAQTRALPAGPAMLPPLAPVAECAKLASADLTSAVGAPTHIASATAVQDGKPAPYCDVTGIVEPAIQFEVRLPLAGWTQRYVQTGCGGLCGNLNIRLGNDDG